LCSIREAGVRRIALKVVVGVGSGVWLGVGVRGIGVVGEKTILIDVCVTEGCGAVGEREGYGLKRVVVTVGQERIGREGDGVSRSAKPGGWVSVWQAARRRVVNNRRTSE
jgi:hypothetical protein